MLSKELSKQSTLQDFVPVLQEARNVARLPHLSGCLSAASSPSDGKGAYRDRCCGNHAVPHPNLHPATPQLPLALVTDMVAWLGLAKWGAGMARWPSSSSCCIAQPFISSGDFHRVCETQGGPRQHSAFFQTSQNNVPCPSSAPPQASSWHLFREAEAETAPGLWGGGEALVPCTHP